MQSYRPLSMLTVDFKILSKILAKRLGPQMGKIIHEDQNGFIPARNMSLNRRRLYCIIEETDTQKYPRAMAASLDLEKAFDSLSWGFLTQIMVRMNLGQDWIRWVTLLYTNPSARVSPRYNIFRGTRQGCPLSPLLFALAMELLAAMMRLRGANRGIPLRDGRHAISLYADDLLLYLKDGEKDLEAMVEDMQDFGVLSGLKLNVGKSCPSR